MPTPPASTEISAFWETIAETSDTFVTDMLHAGSRGEETAEFAAAAARLQAVQPGLLLILGTGNPPEIVISAGGDKSLFRHVLAVVDAAPPTVTGRFLVRAFRPRLPDPTSHAVRFKGRTIRATDVLWEATQHRTDQSVCDLALYLPGFIDALPTDSPANRGLAENVFLILDHLVGEWAVEMQIGAIDWASATKAAPGLPTLADLPAYLDKIAAQ